MRIIHLGDLHLGKVVNNFNLLRDQRFVLEHVLELCRVHQVGAVVLAGDIYDKPVPSAEAVSLLDWFVTSLSDQGIPCLAIPGNHDSADRLAYAQALLAKQGLHLPPLYQGKVTCATLPDEHGSVNFWLLPFLKPVHVRDYFPDQEIGTDYTAAMRAVVGSCNLDPDQRNVLVAHQFVAAGGSATEGSGSEEYLGGLDNIDASLFDGFDYVALGHIHRPQRIGRDQVRYSGSLLKYSFSEVNTVKSAVLVTLGEKPAGSPTSTGVEFELLPLPFLHDMRCIKGDLDHLLSDEVVNAADPEDYLSITLTDPTPRMDARAQILARYPHMMVLEMECFKNAFGELPQVEDATDPMAGNLSELFAQFFERQVGRPMTEDQEETTRSALERAQEGGVR